MNLTPRDVVLYKKTEMAANCDLASVAQKQGKKQLGCTAESAEDHRSRHWIQDFHVSTLFAE